MVSIGRNAAEADISGSLQLIEHGGDVFPVLIVLLKAVKHQHGNGGKPQPFFTGCHLALHICPEIFQRAVIQVLQFGGDKRVLFCRDGLQPLADDLLGISVGRSGIQRIDTGSQGTVQNLHGCCPVRLAAIIVDAVVDAQLHSTQGKNGNIHTLGGIYLHLLPSLTKRSSHRQR